MKKIYCILFLCFCLVKVSKSQMTYDTCNSLIRFEGNWMYVNGNDTIRMCFRKARICDTATNSVDDVIFGWHEYKSSNNIIESNYNNRFIPILYYDTTTLHSVSIKIFINTDSCTYNPNFGYGGVTDYNQNLERHTVVVKINAADNEILWTQRHREGYGFGTGAFGMTLPKQFVLLRQP